MQTPSQAKGEHTDRDKSDCKLIFALGNVWLLIKYIYVIDKYTSLVQIKSLKSSKCPPRNNIYSND